MGLWKSTNKISRNWWRKQRACVSPALRLLLLVLHRQSGPEQWQLRALPRRSRSQTPWYTCAQPRPAEPSPRDRRTQFSHHNWNTAIRTQHATANGESDSREFVLARTGCNFSHFSLKERTHIACRHFSSFSALCSQKRQQDKCEITEWQTKDPRQANASAALNNTATRQILKLCCYWLWSWDASKSLCFRGASNIPWWYCSMSLPILSVARYTETSVLLILEHE